MGVFTVRRMLGPIKTQMGGDSEDNGSGGGGGSDITITNNVSGNILQATGDSKTIAGTSQLTWNNTYSVPALSASSNVFIAGANANLYIQGTDSDGSSKMYKLAVIDGGFYVVPSGSTSGTPP